MMDEFPQTYVRSKTADPEFKPDANGTDTDTDTDGERAVKRPQQAGGGRHAHGRGAQVPKRISIKSPLPPKKKAPRRPAGTVTLASLVEAGVLTAGVDVVTVEYKGTLTHADLAADGRISWRGMFFESPSAFSIYLKRLVNPTRKADDGWKTVKVGGRYLEAYKLEYLARTVAAAGGASPAAAAAAANGAAASDRQGATPTTSTGGGGGGGAPPAKRARTTSDGSSGGAAAAAAPAPTPPAPRVILPKRAGVRAAAIGGGIASVGGGGSPSGGGGAAAAALTQHTPRPANLGSLPPAQHELAPSPGEAARMRALRPPPADPPPPLPQPWPPSGRHYTNGADLTGGGGGGGGAAPGAAAATANGSAAAAPSGDSGGDANGGGSAAAVGASSGRPRRALRAPQRLLASTYPAASSSSASSLHSPGGGGGSFPHLHGGTHEAHAMVPCQPYRGAPGSGAPGAQPFRVQVAPSAELVMDFHAHLDRHEVIGLLAGSWHPSEKLLRVELALPVREALSGGPGAPAATGGSGGAGGGGAGAGAGSGGGSDGWNVEMDSEDQFKVQEVVSELYGLRVVGWYHSHPTFAPLPSLIDISNQLLSQRNARDAAGDEPYVAAIVAPYDRRLPALQSAVTWFAVEWDRGRPVDVAGDPLVQGVLPHELTVERLLRPDTPDAVAGAVPLLRAAALRYARKRSGANMAAAWRDGVRRLNKLLGSLQAWLPPSFTVPMRQRFSEAARGAVLDARASAGLPPLEEDPGHEPEDSGGGGPSGSGGGGGAADIGGVGARGAGGAAAALRSPGRAPPTGKLTLFGANRNKGGSSGAGSGAGSGGGGGGGGGARRASAGVAAVAAAAPGVGAAVGAASPTATAVPPEATGCSPSAAATAGAAPSAAGAASSPAAIPPAPAGHPPPPPHGATPPAAASLSDLHSTPPPPLSAAPAAAAAAPPPLS